MMTPNPEVLNSTLIDKLVAENHIISPSVEAAFRAVLRHHFVPSQPVEDVYQDRAIATKSIDNLAVSSSSQPAMMAIMLEQLGLQPGQRVLEIGAGTGFNAALMAHIVGEEGSVVTIDIDQDIIDEANAHLEAAGYGQVSAICADGGYGWDEGGPYDRIILTVGAGDITPAWWQQLAIGGILVLPLELGSGQMSVAFEKRAKYFLSNSIRNCGFIRLRGVFASEREPQMLGPMPNAHILFGPNVNPNVQPEQLYEELQNPSEIHSTGVQVTPSEAWDGLGWWLLLRDLKASLMVAVGSAADEGFLPALNSFRQSSYSSTVALCSTHGLAVAYIPTELSAMVANKEQFEVMVKQFGKDGQNAADLITLVQEWQQCGRPNSSRMEIWAYPKETQPVDANAVDANAVDANVLVINKPCSQFHIRMR